MGDSYSVRAILSVSDQGFTSKMSGAVKTMEDLDAGAQKSTSSIKDIASGIGVFKLLSKAADTLVSSLDGAVNRFDTLNQYPKVMQNLGYTTEDASVSLDKLSDGITGLPTALDDAATYTKQWALATGDLDKATNLYLAINDGAIAYGASAEQAASCQEQLNQMISTGTFDLQSWKIIQQNCPGLMDAVAQSMLGESAAASDLRTALNDGVVTIDQFESTLISLDQKGTESVTAFSVAAQSATGGIGTSVTNMQTAVVRGMANIIQSTNDALENNGLPGFQGMIEEATSGINTAFSVAAKGSEVLVNNLDILVPTLGTATAGFITYKAAMDISEKATEFKKKMAEAAETVKLAANATELDAKAKEAQETATELAIRAEEKSVKASNVEREARQLQTKAKKASTKATKAQEKADKAAKNAEEIRTKATRNQEAADRAAQRVQESKTASTKLQEDAELAAAKAEESRIAATLAEADAANLQTRADTLSTKATEASIKADTKAAAAAGLRAEADKFETLSTIASTNAEEANIAAQKSSTAVAQMSNIAIAAKAALYGVLSGEITVAAAAQEVFNTAVKSNPVGAAIIGITALVAVIVALTKAVQKYCEKHETLSYRQKQAAEDTEELIESLEESKEAYKDNYKEAKNSAGAVWVLANKTAKLAETENRSTADTELLKSNIEQLNDSVEGLNLAYDEQTGKLNMSENAMLSLVKAYKKQAEAEVYAERYKEILEEQLDVQDQLAESENLLTEAQESLNTQTEYGGSVSAIAVWQMEKQRKAIEELEEQNESLEQEEQELTDKIAQCKAEQTEATQAAADAQIASNDSVKINLEELSDMQQDTLDRIVGAYETMTDSLSSLNDKIEEDDELTWSKVQENQADTIAKTQEFADLYKQAIDAGISESYLNAIGATGPEALPLLRGMMQSGVDEVLASQAEWEAAYDSISNSFVDALQLSDEDKATIRSYISGEAGVMGTMQSAIEACDWSYVGEAVSDGVNTSVAEADFSDTADNVLNSFCNPIATSTLPYEAGRTIGDGSISGTEDSLETGSPSRVYEGLGGDTIDGYILGVERKEGSLNSTMQSIMGSAVRAADKALDDSMKSMFLTSSKAFSNISTVAKIGMKATTTEITNGMKKSNSAVQSGMDMMNAAVSSRMQTIQSYASAGMKKFTQAISSGMSSANAKTASETSNMALAVAGLEGKFYSSGYYASLGLARGINAGSGQAIAAAQKVADSVSATINKALKIHSPSDVTEDSGEFITEGLAVGMLNKLRIVKRASEKIAAAAVPTGEISRMAEAAGRNIVNTDYTYSGNVDATYHFVIPVVIDGREAARATASYTQEELNKKERLNKYIQGYR